MASGVFGLKKIYKRQVENVINNNFNSWTEDFTDAYIIAGNRPSNASQTSIIKYSYFSNSSVILPSASNISPTCGLSNAFGVSNDTYGYYAAGTNSNSNVVSRLDFSTDLSSLPGKNLPTVVDYGGSISRIDFGYGYFVGGQNGTLPNPNEISTITRLDFATETISPTTNLPTSLFQIRAFNGSTYGYAIGGTDPTNTAKNTIYRLDFSNDTLAISLPSKNFASNRSGSCVNESPLYGYAVSGQNVSTIERLDFASETVSALSSLSAGPGSSGSYFSSLSDGYVLANAASGDFSRLDFSNETVQLSLGIVEAREKSSCVSARHKTYNKNTNTFMYANRGTQGGEIDKLSYQTETWTTNLDATAQEQSETSGASTNSYGYIFGGKKGTGTTTLISRLDFSSDTLTSGAKEDKSKLSIILPSTSSTTQFGTTQTNSYAYIIGGSNPGSSSIWRMDFSTDSLVPSGIYPQSRTNIRSVKSATTSYLNFGGGSISTIMRLNFSSETLSTSPTNYPIALIQDVAATATSANYSYGYFLGGRNPGASPNVVSSIYRLDFTNETFTLSSNSVSSSGNSIGGYAYNDMYGYFNVLQSGQSSLFRMDFGTELLTTQAPSPSNRQSGVAYTNSNV
jgi:hypothetical protein